MKEKERQYKTYFLSTGIYDQNEDIKYEKNCKRHKNQGLNNILRPQTRCYKNLCDCEQL